MSAAGRRLDRTTLLAYGALGLPLAALNLPLYVHLPAFYAGEMGLGLAAVGTALAAARLVDTVSDPLIGEMTDRLPTRFGRRRPWLVLAAPVLILATFMLFVPGAGAKTFHLVLWTTVAYLAWTLMLLPYAAWGAELSADYDERSRITLAREGFVLVGILAAAGLPALVPGGIGEGLRALALAMGVLLPLALLALLARVPEPALAPEPRLGLAHGLRLLAANRPFRRLLAAYLLNGIANSLPATLFLLFVGHVLAAPAAGGPLLLAYFAAGIVAVPFWQALSRRIGKHRAWSASMLWASFVFAFVPFLGPGDVAAFLVLCLLSGLSLGADLALPAAIQADVVDLDRLQSGRQRTGLFFAIWSMATKLALALAVGIAFPILDAIGFRPDATNAPGALMGLAFLYAGAPVAIKLVATTLIWRFPLDRGAQEALQRAFAERT